MSTTRLMRSRFRGISWRNPVLNAAFHLVDPVDSVVRFARGLHYLPAYSTRVRSNGIAGQFGGAVFVRNGQVMASMLQEKAHLDTSSDVLEIGCGCGRNALALTNVLQSGSYTGVDIDPVSLEACRSNSLLNRERFTFQFLDVRNSIWNPDAQYDASTFVFPFDEVRFDLIFLVSVFTHMLPPDLANYAKEIGRLLRPGGRCLITVFLMDYGRHTNGISFPYEEDNYYLHERAIPEKAVGYDRQYLESTFAPYGLTLEGEPLLGPWRQMDEVPPTTPFGQDILVFVHQGELLDQGTRPSVSADLA